MPSPILETKLFPPLRDQRTVLRPRLVELLDEGLQGKLTLISAPAGFGKTTLVCQWIAASKRPYAWLSLDEEDNDIARFLSYFVAALRTIAPRFGEELGSSLNSPRLPPLPTVLIQLLNALAQLPVPSILVLDDYHVIGAGQVEEALAFILEHLPRHLLIAIVTREDPGLPLATLRAHGLMTELRAADLRFTLPESTRFLNEVLRLDLSEKDVDALGTRTEGWIAGIQLAGISLRGSRDVAGFIKSFSGSQRYVMDYLVENVLLQQSDTVLAFLLRTSILDRFCGALCDAVVSDRTISGKETLEYLQQANLFLIPLDNEHIWYRYHHLFSDLLRHRLLQGSGKLPETARDFARELHKRASAWFEDNGLEMEAFRHAAAAGDVERSERLIEGKGMPLYFRGAIAPVLTWLESLPEEVLRSRPTLLETQAAILMGLARTTEAEQKLLAAEASLQGAPSGMADRDLVGRIASTRAMLALSRFDIETIISQSRRALEYLHADNVAYRTSTNWKLGYAYQLQGDRTAAQKAYAEASAASEASGNALFALLSRAGLGWAQEMENQLHMAAETYRRVLSKAGDLSLPAAFCESHLGLARIAYEWNDLDTAAAEGELSLKFAQQMATTDRFAVCKLFLARLELARGKAITAAALAAEAAHFARHHGFAAQSREAATTQALILLAEGNLIAAASLAESQDLPLIKAKVLLAKGEGPAALATLEPIRREAEARGWEDALLRISALRALACRASGEEAEGLQLLAQALALAEPGGFIRLFVDEGEPMEKLLSATAAAGIMPDYVSRILGAYSAFRDGDAGGPSRQLLEPLTKRELEVLRLVSLGFSNEEIGDRLFLSLSTVKGHNLRIFDKLQVKRRTEAVARARELGLL